MWAILGAINMVMEVQLCSSRDGGRPKKTRAYSKSYLSGNMGRRNEAKERPVMKRR